MQDKALATVNSFIFTGVVRQSLRRLKVPRSYKPIKPGLVQFNESGTAFLLISLSVLKYLNGYSVVIHKD